MSSQDCHGPRDHCSHPLAVVLCAIEVHDAVAHHPHQAAVQVTKGAPIAVADLGEAVGWFMTAVLMSTLSCRRSAEYDVAQLARLRCQSAVAVDFALIVVEEGVCGARVRKGPPDAEGTAFFRLGFNNGSFYTCLPLDRFRVDRGEKTIEHVSDRRQAFNLPVCVAIVVKHANDGRFQIVQQDLARVLLPEGGEMVVPTIVDRRLHARPDDRPRRVRVAITRFRCDAAVP